MKKSLFLAAGGLALTLAGTGAHAMSFNANASSHGGGAEASQALAPGFTGSLGYFYSDDNDSDTNAYHAQLMFSPYLPGIDLGIGGRYQYLDSAYGNGGGAGITGHVFVPTPVPRVSVGGYGYYQPDGLSHGDLNESYEYGVQARANLVANTYGYVGYRSVHADFDHHGDKTISSSPVIGISVGF